MAEKWDGVTRAADIARVLIKFVSDEDRRMARVMAYGDVGRQLKKRHGECFHGASVGDDIVESNSNGVTVKFDFCDGGDAYELTWNKAAKLICEHIDEYDDDEDEDDCDDDEVTDIAPIEKKEYMSGKEKLFLLTTLTDEQRAEIAESTDLESTTVKELKAKIEELIIDVLVTDGESVDIDWFMRSS